MVVWDISVATSRLQYSNLQTTVQQQRELVQQLPDSHDYRLSGAPIGPLALQMRECDLLGPCSPMKYLGLVLLLNNFSLMFCPLGTRAPPNARGCMVCSSCICTLPANVTKFIGCTMKPVNLK